MNQQGAQNMNPSKIEAQAAAFVNQGSALIHQQQFEPALACFNQALQLKPDMSLAYFNRGVLFHHILKKDAMLADFSRALQLAPNDYDIFYNAAVFLMRSNFYVDALKVAQRAVELKPDSSDAWFLLPAAHYEMGNMESAKKLLSHLVQKFPDNHHIRIANALFMPSIPISNEDIDRSRTQFLEKIDQLIKEKIWIKDPLSERHNSLFFLPYQGREHKEINQKVSEYFSKSCPELSFAASHTTKPRKQSGSKIKMGFVSPSMHKDTLNQFLLKVIEKLNEHSEFEIYVFSNAPAQHQNIQEIKKQIPNYIDLPMHLQQAQQAIAKEEMDILLYMEVGSDQLMQLLPFARLAHMQCVWGGIPVTTGIPNMDYFISCSDCEPEGAGEHYSEELVLLSRVLTVFSRPDISENTKTRTELGLPDSGEHLYACPVLLHKLHPDMDVVFRSILERDPKAHILLFDPKKTLAQNTLMQRFASVMSPDCLSRIIFKPFMSREDFPHMLRAVDCVLDTFHFSFGTTAYISFAAGVPFVTWPGPYHCGRGAYRMLNHMGMSELMAKTHDDFADIALKLAQDKDFYDDMKNKITEHCGQFFDDYEIVDEFAERMKQLYFSEK